MAPAPLDEAALYAEIGRDFRRRLVGVYLCVGVAALLSLGVFNSMSMMHGDGEFTPVEGRIVAVGKDPRSGQLTMTSEFTDATGKVHRDTQHDGYHYAAGDPVVGQRIEYLTQVRIDGELYGFPRADRMLKWVFGGPAAFLLLVGAGGLWFLLRKRALRRRLVRSGRREVGQAPSIRQRTLVLPTGNNVQAVPMWRLEARYFEPARSAFVECHSEWQHSPTTPLAGDLPAPTILVDPERPERYWLPVTPPGG